MSQRATAAPPGIDYARAKIPGESSLRIDYGERELHPPRHHHRGPWAVFQVFDRSRWSAEDRWAAACALRSASIYAVTPEVLDAARRALDIAKELRAEGRVDEQEICLRALLGDEGARAHLDRPPPTRARR